MPAPHRLSFLVVDHNADSRRLLVQTLQRKFPTAQIIESDDGERAVLLARKEPLTAIVSHRTFDYDGETLVSLFRRVAPIVPIVMVSGYDRSAGAIAAGANAFLNYEQWLRIGAVVSDLLEQPKAAAESAEPAGEPV